VIVIASMFVDHFLFYNFFLTFLIMQFTESGFFLVHVALLKYLQ